MTRAQLERRLANIEKKLAALAGQVKSPPAPDVNAWIDEIHGTFTDNATYRRAARLGRQWRKSRRPSTPRSRKAATE